MTERSDTTNNQLSINNNQLIYAFLAFVISALLCGCAARLNYNILDSYIISDNCSGAVEYLNQNKKKYGGNSELLFLLDSAMVNMRCGDYGAAQKNFRNAEDLADKLWTKSISRNIVSMLTNDLILPYAGEDFERVLINLMSAIGYLETGQYDDALVECRRLDSLLSLYNSKYENKNVYKEDAFARYFSGIINEADNELDDAYIDYYKACTIYQDYYVDYGTPVPSSLEEDLLRVAEEVGRLDEALSIVSDSSKDNWLTYKDSKKLGKIVCIHFIGNSPVKKEGKIFLPTKHGPITLAFPGYAVSRPFCRNIKVTATSNQYTKETYAVLVEDINEIAVKNLDDRKGRVIAKTLARAVAKQVVIKEIANQEGGEVIELFLNVLNTVVVERADTRTWRTLPGEIYLGRVFVPEGSYNVYAEQCNDTKNSLKTVNIKAGETGYVVFY